MLFLNENSDVTGRVLLQLPHMWHTKHTHTHTHTHPLPRVRGKTAHNGYGGCGWNLAAILSLFMSIVLVWVCLLTLVVNRAALLVLSAPVVSWWRFPFQSHISVATCLRTPLRTNCSLNKGHLKVADRADNTKSVRESTLMLAPPTTLPQVLHPWHGYKRYTAFSQTMWGGVGCLKLQLTLSCHRPLISWC